MGIIKIINYVLGLAAVFLLLSLLISYNQEDNPLGLTAKGQGNSLSNTFNAPAVNAYLSSREPYDVYEKSLSERSLFTTFAGEERETPPPPPQNPNPQPIEGLDKKIKLVGIVVDKEPQAIVEDLKERQTVFVSPGDRIGDAVVLEVNEDKVIFLYHDQRIEFVP